MEPARAGGASRVSRETERSGCVGTEKHAVQMVSGRTLRSFPVTLHPRHFRPRRPNFRDPSSSHPAAGNVSVSGHGVLAAPPHLIVDSRPEAAAHIPAAARILDDHSAKMPVQASVLRRRQGRVRRGFSFATLGRRGGRVGPRRSGQLLAKLFDQTFQILQPVHHRVGRRRSVGCSGLVCQAACPSRRTVARREDAGDIGSPAVGTW